MKGINYGRLLNQTGSSGTMSLGNGPINASSRSTGGRLPVPTPMSGQLPPFPGLDSQKIKFMFGPQSGQWDMYNKDFTNALNTPVNPEIYAKAAELGKIPVWSNNAWRVPGANVNTLAPNPIESGGVRQSSALLKLLEQRKSNPAFGSNWWQ